MLPLTISRAQENTIPAMTSSPAQSARRIYDAICAATGSNLSPFALETTGGHWASTATVYFLFATHARGGPRR